MITENRINICLRTILSICQSPNIDQYLVGLTSLSSGKKGDQYRSNGFDNLVIIADKLSSQDAKHLESRIQAHIFGNVGTILHRKYHKEKIAYGRIIPSAGGVTHDPASKKWSVYMAWWDREI